MPFTVTSNSFKDGDYLPKRSVQNSREEEGNPFRVQELI
jgi:hypothetical protein